MKRTEWLKAPDTKFMLWTLVGLVSLLPIFLVLDATIMSILCILGALWQCVGLGLSYRMHKCL